MALRLARNLGKPISVASLDALTGTLRSKRAPIATPVKTNEQITAPPKQEIEKKQERKAPLKRTLSYGQTATSLKRTNIANGGITLKRATSFKSIPATKKSVAPCPAKDPQVARVQKQKLTIPHSPNFTNRNRQPPVPKPIVQSTAKSVKTQANHVLKAAANSSSQATGAAGSTVKVVNEVNKRKSSSWMVPFTPERKSPPRAPSSATKPNPSPRTPNVKPFIRKSFSESKTAPNRSTLLSRSVSTVAIRLQSSSLARKSVAPSTLGKESRFSVLKKEPSDKYEFISGDD